VSSRGTSTSVNLPVGRTLLRSILSGTDSAGFADRLASPVSVRGAEAERCLGSQYSVCGAGYQGDFCSECAEEYYTEGERCLPCTPGEALRLYIALGMFVLVLNLLFFFAHPDLTICFLSAVGHLKTFRAVGLYVQTASRSALLLRALKGPTPFLKFELRCVSCGRTWRIKRLNRLSCLFALGWGSIYPK